MLEPLVGMEVGDIRDVLGPHEPAFRSRQLYEAVYQRRIPELAEVSTLPAALRRTLSERHRVGLPGVATVYQSGDGTRRYLLRLDDGRTVETVLMPEEGRDTLCISSQVGCPVNCTFCMTALMGLERNLTPGEIVGQVLLVARENNLDPRTGQVNVVMMG